MQQSLGPLLLGNARTAPTNLGPDSENDVWSLTGR